MWAIYIQKHIGAHSGGYDNFLVEIKLAVYTVSKYLVSLYIINR